jgi:Fe-S-cluster containining protein
MRDRLRAFLVLLEKLIARLMGRRYLRRGKCLKCGKCCRRIVLLHKGRRVARDEDFLELLKIDRRHEWFSPLKADDGDVHFYRCAQLAPDGRCRAYGSRLHLCRTYPHEKIFSYGGRSIEGCGYTFFPIVSFQEVMERVSSRSAKAPNMKGPGLRDR